GAAALGGLALPARAAAQADEGRGPSALLVVLPLVRADHINAWEGGSGTDTPNLDELAGQSLRFDHAIPEVMPSLPVRRTLVTGVRSFPFRDWKRTEGMPAVPGYNPVWDWQPVMTETMRAGGIKTAYVSDNPILEGPRFPDVERPGGGSAASSESGIPGEIAAFKRASGATERTFGAGLEALGRVSGPESFFLAIDPFDPLDASEAPPIYVKPGEVEEEGVGPMDGRLEELNWSDDEQDDLREAYRSHVELVDDQVGRLMSEVPENVLVFVLGDIGVALGDHDYIGRGAPTSHRDSYEIPYLIRHPEGTMGGDEIDWWASTHDVAPTLLSYMGLTIPGKMWGEDLTALFDDVDEDDLYNRPYSITASGSLIMVRDDRWLMVADREQIERRMYDDDEEVEDDIKRYDNIANEDTGQLTEMSIAAVTAAGGTLPEFGPEGANRPPAERGDDDGDDDGIPDDFDAVDNDEEKDGVEPGDLEFDGRDPEDRGKK
ncbi:MAG: sulfatase-like hydrolase/transferase, partial [Actinomycetota bacterium]|nr:sulfatase-like hydrolase/transferase [Actinomycetota bacterium]